MTPRSNSSDPYTAEAQLCDEDGFVRGGPMHHGTDYACTGHAHYEGEHFKCISPAHPGGMPGDLLAALGHEGLNSDESATVRAAIRHTRGFD